MHLIYIQMYKCIFSLTLLRHVTTINGTTAINDTLAINSTSYFKIWFLSYTLLFSKENINIFLFFKFDFFPIYFYTKLFLLWRSALSKYGHAHQSFLTVDISLFHIRVNQNIPRQCSNHIFFIKSSPKNINNHTHKYITLKHKYAT